MLAYFIAHLMTLLLAAPAAAMPPATVADIAWTTQGGFCEPETVLPLPDQTLLVSNVCGFAESGTGYLSLLDRDGEVIHWRAVDGLDAPLGMAMHEQQIYVIDANRLRILEWPGFAPVETRLLATKVANDLAIDAEGNIFVTDTAAGRVLRYPPNGNGTEFPPGWSFKGANGIALDSGFLFVGGERLWRVRLEDGSVETLGPPWLADIDGIEIEPDGTLQLTPVGGPLIRFRDGRVLEVLSGPGVSSANHGYSATLGLALIPTGFDNSVIALRLHEEPPASK